LDASQPLSAGFEQAPEQAGRAGWPPLAVWKSIIYSLMPCGNVVEPALGRRDRYDHV